MKNRARKQAGRAKASYTNSRYYLPVQQVDGRQNTGRQPDFAVYRKHPTPVILAHAGIQNTAFCSR